MRTVLVIALLTLAAMPLAGQEQTEIPSNARVLIATSLGDIIVELDGDRAPLTVQNFAQYIIEGYYEGTIFHRVDPTFVVQGGGYLPDVSRKPAERTVANESGNGLSNRRGTIAMARTGEPHSASSEFFFNLVDNIVLDPRPSRWGYAVFGEVIEGLDVIDRMSAVPTTAAGEFGRDVPIEPILIERIEILDE